MITTLHVPAVIREILADLASPTLAVSPAAPAAPSAAAPGSRRVAAREPPSLLPLAAWRRIGDQHRLRTPTQSFDL